MNATADLNRVYCLIRDGFREMGRAPHYTELARALGVSPEEGRRALHAFMETPFPGWLHPGTDYIASFAPFASIPTQYRVAVEGQQKWYAQCGFESLAMCWLFPGKRVEVDALCLHSGAPLRVAMRDGEVLSAEPESIFGYAGVPFAKWRANLPFS